MTATTIPGRRPILAYGFGGLAGMAAAMGIGRFVYTPILPSMMDSLGLSASDAGLIASANYLGYLAGALMAAGGGSQGRERTIALSALAASAVLCGAMAVSDSLVAFLIVRFLAGVASAYLMVFLSAIVLGKAASAGRPGVQALHFGGVGTGISLSALITGAVFLAGHGWRESWLAAAAVSVVALAAVAMLIEGVPKSAARPAPEPRLVWTAPLVRIALAYGLFGAGYIVTATFLVAIVRQGEGGPLFESAVWLATGLAAAPSVWAWGFVQRRIGLTTTYAVGCLVEAVGVGASVSMGGYAGPLLGGVLLGGTFVAITAFGLQAGRAMAGAAPRRALALLTAVFGTGQIIGPLLAGYLADWTGSFTAPSLGASAVLLLAAVAALSAGKVR
ncbi:MFS transporter [Zhengella mangrovi]|uniref:MFS transporter n=1 Tax=Zhengella mangrovi TaxID=1982044 RepID=A0A2G1QNM5_9HYPH|nr:YbfB/YjiJ family MFS transporter [Zhengella mangrovi]PHP67060.1 MFS transporter [Zhengella mangrovi]